jgi:hypothetical protein
VVLTGWQSEPVVTRSMEQTRRRGVGLRRAACGAAALLSVVLALPSAGAAQSRQPPQPPAVAAPEGYFGVPGGGWLGVGVQTRFTGGPGALSEQVVITRVEPGSPAARAGLRRGDAVLEINGQPAVAAVFHALPFTLNAGDTVRLLVRRQDRDRRVVVVAGERPGRYALERVTPADTLRWLTLELIDSARAAALSAIQQLRLAVDSVRREQRALPAAAARRGRAVPELRDSIAQLRVMIADMEGRLRTAPPPLQPESAIAFWSADPPIAVERPFADAQRLRRVMALRPPDLQFIHMLGERGVAGAEFVELNPGLAQYFAGATEGVLTLRVAPATPAARARLEPGDVIVSVEGRPVRSVGELRAALREASASRPQGVRLGVVRRGERQELVLQADQRL